MFDGLRTTLSPRDIVHCWQKRGRAILPKYLARCR